MVEMEMLAQFSLKFCKLQIGFLISGHLLDTPKVVVDVQPTMNPKTGELKLILHTLYTN